MKNQKYLLLKFLGVYILYFIIGKLLGLEKLALIDIGFYICCVGVGFIILSRILDKKIHLFFKVVISLVILLIVCFGVLVAVWFTPKEHFKIVGNKIVVIKVNSGLLHTYVDLYQLKLLVYKKSLNVGKEDYKGSFDPYNSGYYKLPSDVENFLD